MSTKSPRLHREPPRPLQANATQWRGCTADPSREEVEGAPDTDAGRGADASEVLCKELLLAAGAEGDEQHLGLHLAEPHRGRWIRCSRARGHDAEPGVGGHHPVASGARNPWPSADERYTVTAALGLGKVRGDQVGSADALCAGVTATPERADDADAVGNQQRGRIEHRSKLAVAAGEHHHLGVEGDDQRRPRAGVAPVPFDEVNERAHRLRHVDDVDRAPEHASARRRSGGRR